MDVNLMDNRSIKSKASRIAWGSCPAKDRITQLDEMSLHDHTFSEFTELAELRFLDCDSCGMTQGALIRYVADP